MLVVSVTKLQDLNLELYQLLPDIIELRLDLFSFEDLVALSKESFSIKTPILVCLKPSFSQSGLFIPILKNLRPDYVDLDFTLFDRFHHQVKTILPNACVVVSKHTKQMYELKRFYKKFKTADLKKLVIETDDVLCALKLALFAKKQDLILFTQGRQTSFSRFFSKWHYCYFEKPTGIGQYQLKTLAKLYSKTSEAPPFYALIGDPIEHSPSHITHNYIFKTLKLGHIYLKLPIKPKELLKGLIYLKQLKCSGLSITTPHKPRVLMMLQKTTQSPPINTFSFKTKKFCNTDILALEHALGLAETKTILLLGNGACSLAFQNYFHQKKLPFTLWTRRSSTALKDSYDVIINATSSDDPLIKLPSCKLLINLYHKKDMPLIETKAQNQGADIFSGQDFFLTQAFYQFEFFFQKTLLADRQTIFSLVKQARGV